MDCIAVIPARLAASRFPGKLLSSVAGKPLIEHVIECVLRIPGIDKTVLTTDDESIAEVARNTAADVVLSSGHFASGTDRVAAAAAHFSADLVVNVQGDELLLDADEVGAAIDSFRASDFQLGTLRAPLAERRDLWDPNVVKVVIDSNERALYFSRAPLPFPRHEWQHAAQLDGSGTAAEWLQEVPQDGEAYPAWTHVGVYLYRAEALQRWAAMPPSTLEISEGLEQLRVLEAGEHMQTYLISEAVPGVNTPRDLEKAGAALAARAERAQRTGD
jgi:3-deoxy-manno-octulosonate cytidylyltransferase (CMP-KDO synthetase)